MNLLRPILCVAALIEERAGRGAGNPTIRSTTTGRVDQYYEHALVLYESFETEIMTQTLYSFIKADGTTGYGTHIGTNSKNEFLIEEKGNGTIHTFDKKDLEEVLPYTFTAKTVNTETNFVGTPDTLKVGDHLLSSAGQIYVVTKLDTKEKNAKKFNGVRLVTEAI
jgi:hypothetical protein